MFAAVKGIIHEPSEKPTMKPESRDALLTAIAKAREWIDDIRRGRFASFVEIAEREAVGERHIRLLAPLALLSPRIIAAIADGTAPADLTVTGLAKALPYSWAEQERARASSSAVHRLKHARIRAAGASAKPRCRPSLMPCR
jgi:site-specific DNA recombinase